MRGFTVPHHILTAPRHLFTTSSTDIDPLSSWVGLDPLSSLSVSIQEMFQGPTDQSFHYPTSSSTYSPSPPPSVNIVPTNGMEVFAPNPQSTISAVFPVDLGSWQDLDMSSAHPSFVDDHGMDMSLGVEIGMSDSYRVHLSITVHGYFYCGTTMPASMSVFSPFLAPFFV